MTIKLDEYQQQAIDHISSLKSRMYIMTGGAGTGKTTTIQHLLLKLWGDFERTGITDTTTYISCPTGKGARVIRDSFKIGGFQVENEPCTVHRMLQYIPGLGWVHNKQNPLQATLVIVDEASMLSSVLLAAIIDALPGGCVLILVGDKAQLMPVEPGSPFDDIISYGNQDDIFRLTKNFRQQQGSLIADACERILQGKLPRFGIKGKHTLGGPLEDDLFLKEEEDKELIPEEVARICRLWNNSGDDWICLSPQTTGACGVDALNKYLQEKLNPAGLDKAETKGAYGVVFRIGDRILHKKNAYDLGMEGIFNGFTGIIIDIGTGHDGKKFILVDYGGEQVEYRENKHISMLALGYCLTYHKSQGSQWQKGVIVMHSSHYFMMNRNLTYTGVSRFRKELHIIGNQKAIKRGVSNVVAGERQTLIKLRLKGEK